MSDDKNYEATTLDDVADALQFLNFADREVWVHAAFSIKSAFGEAGFDVWDIWGQQFPKYKRSDAMSTWRSAKMSGTRTIASLFHDARAAGYNPREYNDADRKKAQAEWREREKKLVLEREADERRRCKMGDRARQVSQLILNEHCKAVGKSKYLGLKKIQPCGAAFPKHHMIIVTDDEAENISVIFGKDQVNEFYAHRAELVSFKAIKPGCVLVPLLDENLQAHNLQIIYEGGKKSFLKWGRKSGLFFVIGVLTGDQPIVICEGFATGASIALAAGLPVVVAFDSGNLPPVAQKIRALFPGRELLIAGDDDAETPGNPGVAKAKEAAGLVGAKFVFPEFKTEDVNAEKREEEPAN